MLSGQKKGHGLEAGAHSWGVCMRASRTALVWKKGHDEQPAESNAPSSKSLLILLCVCWRVFTGIFVGQLLGKPKVQGCVSWVVFPFPPPHPPKKIHTHLELW